MSLYATCADCDWSKLVAEQPVVADLDEAGKLCREHNLSEHFALITVRENGSECPQPCIHLSQEDAREGRTCAEHPCTCTNRENGSER